MMTPPPWGTTYPFGPFRTLRTVPSDLQYVFMYMQKQKEKRKIFIITGQTIVEK